MTTLHEKLLVAFARDPEAVAVSEGKANDLSYGELFAHVARMARHLTVHKVTTVGILSTRRSEAYISVLGAFFAGVKFVPMNPDLPQDRLDFILQAGGVQLVTYDKSTAKIAQNSKCATYDVIVEPLAGSENISLRIPDLEPSAIAYHMFTSGSTGVPKGVPISYQSLVHYVDAIIAATGICGGKRFSQLFDLSFDLSLHDIFVAMASNGTLCPASNIDLMMPHAYIQKKKIDNWFSVPMLAMIAARSAGNTEPSHKLSSALFCGEPLPMAYARDFRRFVASDEPIWNLYGPTEATIAFTCKPVDFNQDAAGIVPLGEPFGENRIAIETEVGSVVDITEGVEGELLLGGSQVFSGYSPAEDTACFTTTTPIYYRSGDLVRVSHGELHHLGRTDSQIKLRGYRIELGDVEAAVRRAFGLDVLACVVIGDGESRQIALAYVAIEDIATFDGLEDHLPVYMIPKVWMRLAEMPLNMNGKIDRKALRAMDWPT